MIPTQWIIKEEMESSDIACYGGGWDSSHFYSSGSLFHIDVQMWKRSRLTDCSCMVDQPGPSLSLLNYIWRPPLLNSSTSIKTSTTQTLGYVIKFLFGFSGEVIALEWL